MVHTAEKGGDARTLDCGVPARVRSAMPLSATAAPLADVLNRIRRVRMTPSLDRHLWPRRLWLRRLDR
jgi:hypothetical protein